ncbi:uncharacterized protein B0P05DRAFT_544276 [Gilbertella persicaria]|uniref:uncharacterized protein n=1 Tax=Gilbertella persicaria TaxID=101096 RepID=UPI0022202708|nr:uncharacterized protein B0P05DRAFT_544276 [Gilbertella persicaria]KAI8077264.1 hypothetical protein B0P05DRAFT_544276 [Gilbertella persicaria]
MAYESQPLEQYGEWTMERVLRWLDSNSFQSVMEVFQAKHICGKAFLEIDMSFLMSLQNELMLSYTEKRRLAHAIKALKATEDNHYTRTRPSNRYQSPSDTPVPLIPERTSSNNEQVLDWMKSFNIPKRTLVTNARNMNRYPVQTVRHSANHPRVTEQEGAWKFVRRRPPTLLDHPVPLPPQAPQQSIHVTRDSDTFHSLQVSGMHDPRLIKNAILRKLGLEGSCERYLFYHENGKQSETPLTDSELSHLCQISDHTSTNRILVKPKAEKPLERYRSYTQDGTICYDFAMPTTRQVNECNNISQITSNRHYYNERSMSNNDYDLNVNRSRYEPSMISPINGNNQFSVSHSPLEETNESWHQDKISLWAVKPSKSETTKETSLWAVPPQSQPQPSTSKSDTLKEPPSLWAVPPSNEPVKEPPSLWAVPPSNEPVKESPSLWAVPPSNEPVKEPPSLWAVPPQPALSKSETTTTTTTKESPSLWAIVPRSEPAKEPSLWAVAPQPTISKSETTHDSPSLWAVHPQPTKSDSVKKDTQGLWAIPPPTTPQFGSENLNLHPSIKKTRGVQFADEDNESVASAPAIEEGVESINLSDPPNMHHTHSAQQLSIDTSVEDRTTPLSSPSGMTSDEENWAERPTVERLYRNIDKYLPGHDLDKEIIVDSTQPNPTPTVMTTPGVDGATMVTALPPGRRLGGHKKSIRHVANEAHRNWRNAVNVIRANNNLMRRRSTKMWHRAVEQVKPGMKLQTDSKPKSRKLQWIRGELIGKGSFGRVYHALNVEAGEWIAVKQVDLPSTKADYANPQMREMKDALFREISLLEDLDNEYIVQYLGYDMDEEEGHINIFLEYVPGGSIASCLLKTGKFEEPLVRFLTQQILMGLAYLHNRNILHRDIKAGNILLDQHGVCKITDFGLSKLSGQDKAYDPHSNNSVMRGTVFWMAPEVVKGTNYNAKVDIWSLGCTVIEMLTGNHPWLDLNMLAALYSLGKYQAPPIPEDLSQYAKDFLAQCFIINPEDRPTAEQLLAHPFVQPDPSFEFKKYMKKAEIERRASKRLPAISVE